jgi:hypothetical protein
MRKIQPENIHTGSYQFQQLIIRIAGRAYRGYYFSAVMCVLDAGFFVLLFVKIFFNVFSHILVSGSWFPVISCWPEGSGQCRLIAC